jgi:hypothetical protein
VGDTSVGGEHLLSVSRSELASSRDDFEGEEHLGRQIFSLLSAERACDCDRLEWKLADAGGHVALAPLAGDDKLLSTWSY